MCFALQRRAIFPHLVSTSKCPGHGSFLTFWLANVLLATAVCNFATSQLQKAVRPWGVLYILTSKCASRYSGVHFFHIPTSKRGPHLRCFAHFDFKMRFAPQRRAIFHFSSQQVPPRPPLYRLLFDPADPQIVEKTKRFATFLTFRACGSSFYWLSRNCIFFLLALLLFSAFHFWLCFSALLFQLSILLEVRLLNFLWQSTTQYYSGSIL